MSGIYIPNMEMPKNCAECFFHKVFPATGVGINQIYCPLCGINIVKLSDVQPDCPLVPVPDHGRLIDADALKDTLDYYIREAGWGEEINKALGWVKDDFVDSEQTVIPADKDGT